jgi:hypothetical protein
MAKAKQLPSKREAFDRAYDKSRDGQVNTKSVKRVEDLWKALDAEDD